MFLFEIFKICMKLSSASFLTFKKKRAQWPRAPKFRFGCYVPLKGAQLLHFLEVYGAPIGLHNYFSSSLFLFFILFSPFGKET